MTKQEMIKSIGFESYELNLSTFKNAKIKNRISESEYYEIYINETEITIYSRWLVTKEEIKYFQKLTGKKYISIGTKMENEGLWDEWRKAKNNA